MTCRSGGYSSLPGPRPALRDSCSSGPTTQKPGDGTQYLPQMMGANTAMPRNCCLEMVLFKMSPPKLRGGGRWQTIRVDAGQPSPRRPPCQPVTRPKHPGWPSWSPVSPDAARGSHLCSESRLLQKAPPDPFRGHLAGWALPRDSPEVRSAGRGAHVTSPTPAAQHLAPPTLGFSEGLESTSFWKQRHLGHSLRSPSQSGEHMGKSWGGPRQGPQAERAPKDEAGGPRAPEH